eukprot:2786299-Rhodomonas_salina.1
MAIEAADEPRFDPRTARSEAGTDGKLVRGRSETEKRSVDQTASEDPSESPTVSVNAIDPLLAAPAFRTTLESDIHAVVSAAVNPSRPRPVMPPSPSLPKAETDTAEPPTAGPLLRTSETFVAAPGLSYDSAS